MFFGRKYNYLSGLNMCLMDKYSHTNLLCSEKDGPFVNHHVNGKADENVLKWIMKEKKDLENYRTKGPNIKINKEIKSKWVFKKRRPRSRIKGRYPYNVWWSYMDNKFNKGWKESIMDQMNHVMNDKANKVLNNKVKSKNSMNNRKNKDRARVKQQARNVRPKTKKKNKRNRKNWRKEDMKDETVFDMNSAYYHKKMKNKNKYIKSPNIQYTNYKQKPIDVQQVLANDENTMKKKTLCKHYN